MSQRFSIKKILAVLICALISVSAFTVSALLLKSKSAYALGVFGSSSDVTVTDNFVIDGKYQTDAREGIKLTAQKSGDTISVSDVMSGDFEMDFRVFTGEEVAPGAPSKNYVPTIDLNTLSFIFTDVNNGKQFKLVIDASSNMGFLPMAHVSYDGGNYGRFGYITNHWANIGNNAGFPSLRNLYNPNYVFSSGHAENNSTKFANNGKTYSYLLDTSFANSFWYHSAMFKEVVVGSYEFIEVTENKTMNSIKVGFDPSNMTVYSYCSGEKFTIWDFSNSVNDGYDVGFTLDGFEQYSVDIEFTSVNDNGAEMVVYEINGQGVYSEEDAKPSVYAPSYPYAIKGDNVVIKKPYAYDIVDSSESIDINAKISVSVQGPMGPVSVTGLNGNLYADGANFNAKNSGNYYITYSVTDKSGNVSTKTSTVKVYETLPKSVFAFEKPLEDEYVIGVGETLTLPLPEVKNELLGNFDARAEIYDGVNYIYTSDSTKEITYTFTETGDYEIVFSYEEVFGDELRVPVRVTNELPAFNLSEKLNAVYLINDKITVPTATATFNNSTVNCTYIITYPDGSKYSSKAFTAKQLGKYSVEYTASFGGNNYNKFFTFNVVESVANLFTIDGATELQGVVNGSYNDNETGLMVHAKGGSTLTYQNVINFNGKTSTDPFIVLKAMPTRVDVTDIKKMTITLYDVNDRTNALKIIIHKDEDMTGESDVRAGTNSLTIGVRDTYPHSKDPYGTMIPTHSFFRNAGELAISMDYEKRIVYANGIFVVDLDDPIYFSTLWNGFSEGLATMTVEITEYLSEESYYMIKSVDGIDLTKEKYTDTDSPVIFVDLQGYQAIDLPYGIVGNKYPLFSCAAYDSYDGFVDCFVTCIYKKNGVELEVNIEDGFFIPEKAGEYCLKYVAYDNAHNASSYYFDINVYDSIEKLSLELSDLIGDGKTGEYITLPSYRVKNASGKYTVLREVTLPNGNTEAFGDNYLPTIDGTYTFTYKVTDYIGQEVSESYVFTSSRNNAPVIQDVKIYEYAVQGEEFGIPETFAYDYSNGTCVKIDTTAKVIYNAQETTITDGVFVPAILDQDTTLTIQYSATSAHGDTAYKYYEIKAVKIKESTDEKALADFTKLFAGENMSVVDTSFSDNSLIYRTTVEGAELKLVRPMVGNNVEFKYTIPSGYGNFETLRITLTDGINLTDAIAFDIYRASADSNYSLLKVVGDDTEYSIGGSFNANSNIDFYFLYNNETATLTAFGTDGAAAKITVVRQTVDGKDFTGFANGLVNVKFAFNKITGRSGIKFLQLGTVNLSRTREKDSQKPYIYLMGGYKNYMEFGSELTILKAYASDILSSAKVTVTVSAPDNSLVLDNADCSVEHKITVNQYGSYLIKYVATDAANKKFTLNEFFYCIYSGGIELTVSKDVVSSAGANSKINIPEYTVKSNRFVEGEDLMVAIFVFDADNVIRKAGVGEYELGKAGTYIVRYYAYDIDGNYAIKDYRITVK